MVMVRFGPRVVRKSGCHPPWALEGVWHSRSFAVVSGMTASAGFERLAMQPDRVHPLLQATTIASHEDVMAQ